MTRTLAEVMAPVRHVLLDFDGPVCSVFGELPAPVVARRLAEAIDAELPDEVVGTDPLALLSVFAERGRDKLVAAEAKLTELEIEAVQAAPNTPGLPDLLQAFRDTGRAVTIVSNNSDAAVRTFIDRHKLAGFIAEISSRSAPDPFLLKPNPALLLNAMRQRGSELREVVMIGDNVSDEQAANRAHVSFIGLARNARKRQRFTEAGMNPHRIIASLWELLIQGDLVDSGRQMRISEG